MGKLEIPRARVVRGPGLTGVALAAVVLVVVVLVALYFVASSAPAAWTSFSVSSITRQIEGLVGRFEIASENQAVPIEPLRLQSQLAPTSIPSVSQSDVVPSSRAGSKTYDIGAYLTYGGQAFTMTRATAKLSADRRRLAVGLFEGKGAEEEKPALALLIEFNKPQPTCNIANVKELSLLFDLRAMGGVAAQKTQVVKRSQSEIRLSLTDFSCDLKPGGTLNLHSLGADPALLKPKGTTFGWGVRLSQEIG